MSIGQQQREYRDEIWRLAAAHEAKKIQQRQMERELWGTAQMVLPLVNEVACPLQLQKL